MDVVHLAFSPDRKRLYIGGHDVVVVDVTNPSDPSAQRRLRARPCEYGMGRFRGWLEAHRRGVGDRLKIYDEDTLELIEEKILEGDAMFAPFPLPRRPVENASQ